MMTGIGDAWFLTYCGKVHHGIQVVKMHDQNEIFLLIVAFKVDKSPEVDN